MRCNPPTDVPRVGCPKRMVFGPCGGVRDDGRCELAEHPCVFLDAPLVPLAGPPRAAGDRASAAARPGGARPGRARGPVRHPVRPGLGAPRRRRPRARSRTGCSSASTPTGPTSRRRCSPPRCIAAGGRVWTTLACRDRNRVVLEQELAGLAAVGVDGVLCVTGDGRGASVRPGVTQVFDLDGVRLAALAAGMGLPVAVPESPEAPPVGLRPARVAEKQRAGAQLCVLNHVSSPARVAEFVAAARAAGATLPFVAGVAVYTDEPSARVLQRFPGLHLDDDGRRARCWPPPTRGRRASPPPSRRRGRCSRSPASSA